MKKLMMTMAVATALTACAYGEVPHGTATGQDFRCPQIDNKFATEADYRAVFNEMMATNALKAMSIFLESRFYAMSGRADLSSACAEFDAALAAHGVGAVWYMPNEWPRVSAVHRELLGVNTNMPNAVALASKYGCRIWPSSLACFASLEELAGVLNDIVQCRPPVGLQLCYDAKRAIQTAAARDVRRQFRKLGRSFVAKDGVNPCSECLSRLTRALNAPRMSGLNEWFAEMGYAARLDQSRLPPEAEIAALRESVLMGDTPMYGINKVKLYLCLGVDGYNAFVKEYNGD